MTFRQLTSIAAVVVVGIISAGTFIGAGFQEPNAITDSQPASEELKNADDPDGFSPYVDKNGQISLPQGFRQQWAHLGSWAVARKRGSDVVEMHDVYTPRETISAYNKTGEFPDGAALVKEVRKAQADRLTSGHAAWSTDMKVWFVMIKDRKGRFEGNDHWGEGWGWALFEAKDPTKNVSVDYETSCIDCHAPVEDRDWIFVYGYPDLKKLGTDSHTIRTPAR